ncbi:hypothetical protein [Novosphingobium rosa]|uniref:hypothetical protein n=1 Tax=Novosphingobium rosa TaxID=76978 RepID=UPI000831DFAE|nr:hypothetical protein [Novosphingobium rosa]
MSWFWNRDFLTRRIDRCYLIAAGTKKPHKREAHLELARRYRRLLTSLGDYTAIPQEPAVASAAN